MIHNPFGNTQHTYLPLLLEAETVSLVVNSVASSSSMAATIINDDKNETNFGS